METPVQPGFRVIRGPDWFYKNQDGGKGHAGTVLVMHDERQPHFPNHTVLVQWDNGDKGLYRVGYDQAFDLRIIETANSVCHPKIWCDGCNADEIKGIRWRCSECYAIDLCTTCYMNDQHDLSHVFMRVLTSDKTSLGPKMLPRSSSPRIALRGSFPGAKVVGYPQWYKRFEPEKQLGKVARLGQTPEDKVKVQTVIEFSPTRERINFTKIACTLPGSGGYLYDGHLPNLGDLEGVNEGDDVLVTATPEELEKLHKRRGLWDPNMSKTFRRKGFVNKRTNTGDFKVTFSDSQETFTMNSKALRKLYRLCLGKLVRIDDDMETVKRLQFGHGGWTAAMKQAISRVGKVVKIDGSDIHVKVNNHKFIFNSANLTPARAHFPPPDMPEEECVIADVETVVRHLKEDPESSITAAVVSNDIQAVESILKTHPDWVHFEIKPGKTFLFQACSGHANMVKFLVEKGAFIESYDETGTTPLIQATVCNNPEAVRYLLEQGADVNATTFQGHTSLSLSCSMGFFECAHYLLRHGADMNHKGEQGLTPLLLSVQSGGRTIVDLIMDRKEADLKTVSKELLSVMHLAADRDNPYAPNKLLDKVPRLVEATDSAGCTPLLRAIQSGSLKVAELLIKKGHCNVNAVDNIAGICPLSAAIAQTQFHLVDILIRNGADPNLPNHFQDTSLQIAVNVVNDTQRQYVKEESYMTEMKKKWGHLGIKTNGDALLAYLVSHGGDLNAYNSVNITIREVLRICQHPILQALDEIQSHKGKDIARQQSTATRPLRNLTKKTDGTIKTQLNSMSSLLKQSAAREDSKKQSIGKSSEKWSRSSGSRQNSLGKESTNVCGREAVNRTAQESTKKTSDTVKLSQLQVELQRKDEELEALRSRVKTLEHLVKKKIFFSCGHDVIRSIADLIPECPHCSKPITSVTDLQ